jgi:peptidoglycan/LPS O-acetylase OafA/YrhL
MSAEAIAPGRRTAPAAGGFRRDRLALRTAARPRILEIDGLRAIALTLVVLFHLFGQGRVSGGVDVFLFVSGVVLALAMDSSVKRGEERRVAARWVRTFGRLAPPAALVLVTIVAMSFTVLPPWTRTQTLTEVTSAAWYFENWQLIWSQLAYGAAGPLTSPVQHFWSLSVQGQLFVIVPLVVAVAYSLRRYVRRPGLVLWVTTAAATLSSFVYAVVANAHDPASAYLDTFARAWELGAGVLVGGLLVLGMASRMPVPMVAGWLGLVMILVSGFVIDGATAYPGPAALVPIFGAALVVLSVGSRSRYAVGAMLRSRPLSSLTRISYALYLWHWPVLIGYLAMRDRVDGVIGWDGAGIILGVSIVLATLTWWLLERPLERLLGRGRQTHGAYAALLSMLLVPMIALGGAWVAQSTRPAVTASGCHGAAAVDPERPECSDAIDPASALLPPLDGLQHDDDNRAECWARPGSHAFEMCTVGLENGYSHRLLAVGDSHNNTLLGVYEEIALAHGWRIDVAGRAACHWTDAPRIQRNTASAQACDRWNTAVDTFVAETPLDAILVTNSSRAGYDIADHREYADAKVEGYLSAWAQRADPTTPVVAIRDNPIFGSEALTCVMDAAAVREGRCVMARSDALLEDGLADAVLRDAYAHLVDLNGYMCDDDVCHMVVGGVITTRDGSHLTATYARTLAPYLDRELSQILGG